MKKKITIVIMLTILGLSSAFAQVVLNGDFTNNFTNWAVVNYTSGASTQIINEGGNNVAKLHHNSGCDWNAIGQEVRSKLTNGIEYQFQCRYKVNGSSNACSGQQSFCMVVAFADNSLVMHSHIIASNSGCYQGIFDNNWHNVVFNFTATSTFPQSDEPKLAITSNYGGMGDLFIDDISISGATVITANPATNLTCSSATLNGGVNPNNETCTVSFEYGLTTAYGTIVSATPATISGNSITNITTNITGLIPGATYHYRVKSVNQYCTIYGADTTFTTLQLPTKPTKPTGASILCINSANTYYTTSATNATTYQWGISPAGAGIITGSGTTGTVVWNNAFTGTAKIFVNGINSGICNGEVSDTLFVSITAITLVSPSNFININANPITLNGIPAGGTYSGQGVSDSTFNPQTAGLGNTIISYSYTNGSGCNGIATQNIIVYDTTGVVCTTYDTITAHIAVTDTLIINAVITGINPPNNINTIKVFPNPTSTGIYIDCGNFTSMNGYTIKIDNSLAQTVYTTSIAQQQYYVNLSSWSGNGTYFVYIIDDLSNIIDVRKIILQ